MGYRIKFDSKKCVGCYACYVACIDAHHDAAEEEANSRRTIKKTVTEGFEKNICPGCIHCGKCISVCPTGAIYRDEESAFVLTDPEKCIGCGKCEEVCPLGVIRFDATGKMEKCDGCIGRLREGREPACVRVCCNQAITLENV